MQLLLWRHLCQQHWQALSKHINTSNKAAKQWHSLWDPPTWGAWGRRGWVFFLQPIMNIVYEGNIEMSWGNMGVFWLERTQLQAPAANEQPQQAQHVGLHRTSIDWMLTGAQRIRIRLSGNSVTQVTQSFSHSVQVLLPIWLFVGMFVC
jgi:hypothetical protein